MRGTVDMVNSWPTELKSKAQQIIYSGDHYTSCTKPEGDYFPVSPDILPDDCHCVLCCLVLGSLNGPPIVLMV